MHYIEITINTPLRDVGPSKDRLESDDLKGKLGAVLFDNDEENIGGRRDEWELLLGKVSSVLDFVELDDRKGGVPHNNRLLYWGECGKRYPEDGVLWEYINNSTIST